MKKGYSNIRGTSDFSGSAAVSFSDINAQARRFFKIFNYQELILPVLEEKGLFVKGVGQVTDIVQKQMFKIEGKDIVLRPEATAQVVRFYLQNAIHKKTSFSKFFYLGPMFRGERPQKGRLRQFNHIGAEAIGSDSFYLDAEIIDLSLKILDAAGIKEKKLLINSLGCEKDKKDFSKLIKKELTTHKKHFCEDCRRRLDKNPLRVLDCKEEKCQKLLKDFKVQMLGPTTCLCGECADHFSNLWHLLKDLGIEYEIDRYLVRGLDYYTNTVFEIVSSQLGSKDALGAGGRYNNLIKSLGGPEVPAIGFALGLERILIALGQPDKEPCLDVFVAVGQEEFFRTGFDILRSLQAKGISCDCDYNLRSLKAQLRQAEKSGARFTVVVAADEYKKRSVGLKDMKKRIQEEVKIKDLINKITGSR